MYLDPYRFEVFGKGKGLGFRRDLRKQSLRIQGMLQEGKVRTHSSVFPADYVYWFS